MGNPEVFASELKYLTTPDQSGHQQISRSQLFFPLDCLGFTPGSRRDLTNKTTLIARVPRCSRLEMVA